MAKRYPKLRFALIPSDALEQLRSEPKPDVVTTKDTKDMYDQIMKTVDTLIDEKLKTLKLDQIDKLIEHKVSEVNKRHREIRKAMRGLNDPIPPAGQIFHARAQATNAKLPTKLDERTLNSLTAKSMRSKKVKIFENEHKIKRRSQRKPIFVNDNDSDDIRTHQSIINEAVNVHIPETKKQNSTADFRTKCYKGLHNRCYIGPT